jgi:ppGpp synthetase/RelA/SpoT-type nucleotidyltranferase
MDATVWFQGERARFESLAAAVGSLLSGLLRADGVDHLPIESRVKTVESFEAKLRLKKYQNPQVEVTDLCGLRVVTYLEADVLRVVDLVRRTFQIDDVNSVDKSGVLEVDRVGYRSVHYVCQFGPERAHLPEYSTFAGLRFEVQIRTVLQHAWAQIEHDRNYKPGVVLPAALKRRLYLAAGLLEVADREFDAISREVVEYAAEVSSRASRGDLAIELNSTSLRSYLERLLGERNRRVRFGRVDEDVVGELHAMGLQTLEDVDALMTDQFFNVMEEMGMFQSTTDAGILRDLLIYTDLDRYFREAWNGNWTVVERDTRRFLEKIAGPSKVDDLIKQYDLWDESMLSVIADGDSPDDSADA